MRRAPRRWTRRRRSPACTARRCWTRRPCRSKSNVALALVHEPAARTTASWSRRRSPRTSTCTADPSWRRRRPPRGRQCAERGAGRGGGHRRPEARSRRRARRSKFMIERFQRPGSAWNSALAERDLRRRPASTPTGASWPYQPTRATRAPRRCSPASRRAAGARCSCASSRACRDTRPKPRCWPRSRPRWPGAAVAQAHLAR